MEYRYDENVILLSADELCSYAYEKENPALLTERFGFLKTVVTVDERGYAEGLSEKERVSRAISGIAEGYAEYIETTHTEIPLETEETVEDYTVRIRGLSDIISYDGLLHTVEVIRPVRKSSAGLTAFTFPDFFAKAVLLSKIYADELGVSEIRVKLTFILKKNGERVSFTALMKKDLLDYFHESLLERATPFILSFAESRVVLPGEIKTMPFPYPAIRSGQEQFIKEAYRTIRHGENLLVSAPTGIGKTMSALFPAVKAYGSGDCDKIFYLTAKTVTGRGALEAAEKLVRHAPHLRAVMILSKESCCSLKRKFSKGILSNCLGCSLTDSLTDENSTTYSYREREIRALTYLLRSEERVFTPEIIKAAAETFAVCPYELSLDLSEQCQLVVCDINYVIDDNVRFRRYFKKDKNSERYIFLFDEAHNLPDRTRNTYSATTTRERAQTLFQMLEDKLPAAGKLYDAGVAFLKSFDEIIGLTRENESIKQIDGHEVVCGFYEDTRVTDSFAKASVELMKEIAALPRDNDCAEELAPYYSELFKIAFVLSYFDDRFRFFCSRIGDDVTVELLCIDPSGILEQMLSVAHSVILFSATLSPLDYFCEVLGLDGANALELESPYEKENLCLVTYDSVSTRYSERNSTAEDCAEVIAATVSARVGNYLVYFPSYEYMKRVCRSFAQIMPECGIVMQKPGMSYKERNRFIDLFRERRGQTVVGFCVLGGVFSEGIDLAGESLIGAIIVGCGMPQISAERNIMAAYYQEKNERGQEFAYVCPGMNKIMQAAGRVIRSESDRGVVVLVDDRLNDPNRKILFPPHWRHMKYTGNIPSLTAVLDNFWEENE